MIQSESSFSAYQSSPKAEGQSQEAPSSRYPGNVYLPRIKPDQTGVRVEADAFPIRSIPSHMDYQIEKHEDILILSLNGRLLGEHQTIALMEQVEEQIELGYVNFVIDLSNLEFINSTGLNFLLTLLTKGRKQDGEVLLCNLNELLSNLIITTKLNSFFTIAESRQEALAHFAPEEA